MARIFESPGFFRSARMRRFLEFIVECTLSADGDPAAALKESLIGIAVFDRDPSYDPKADPIVRVEARRLRAKLVEYYQGPGKSDPFVIELPKGGYVPLIRHAASALELPEQGEEREQPEQPRPAGRGARDFHRALAVTACITLAVAAWVLWPRAEPPLTPAPLTSYEGSESGAAFSPDGKSIAYAWNGPGGDNFDIYSEIIGSHQPRRLTTDPAADFSPRWSHDGRTIAFLRQQPGKPLAVMTVAAAGGTPVKVADTSAAFDTGDRELDWLPGDKSLVTVDRASPGAPFAIFEVAVSSGRKRQITFPSPGEGDACPSVSPGGRRLAFVRDVGHGVSRLFVLDLDKPRSKPHLLAWPQFLAALSVDPAWTADGRSIVFSSNRGGPIRLWEARISGGQPRLLAALGERVSQPAVSPAGGLAYTTAVMDTNIWRLDIGAALAGNARPEPAVMSTRQEHRAQVSPDGTKVAFESDRSGPGQIWIARVDGSGLRQITFFERGAPGSPRWSPDGTRIVCDSRAEGQPEIYEIPANGGPARRLTNNPALDILPVYSPDGRWIYFSSNRSGSFQIWRMPASGGPAVQITHAGGSASQPSPDGKFVYFTLNANANTSLWRVASDGGEEARIIDSLLKRSFAVTSNGSAIVFMRSQGDAGADQFLHARLHLLDLATGNIRMLATLDRPVVAGLSASIDGRYVYFSQVDREGSDLALVRGFR